MVVSFLFVEDLGLGGYTTAAEVAIYYVSALRSLLVPMLIVFALIKFVLVALWFMHLRFDSPIFKRFFATGVVLAMHYASNATVAFSSVEHIMRDVNWGWLMRYAHANGASAFFVVIYLHIFRGFFYSSYKAPREMIWLLGVVIFLLMMATAFMGYVLPWGQMSFWGAKVIPGLFGAIPLVGEPIQIWLLGGYAPDNAALNRFFSLHFLLPFVIAGVVILHIWALHIPGSGNPTGVDVKSPQDTVPFHPYYTAKDGFGLGVFLILVAFMFSFVVAMTAAFLAAPAIAGDLESGVALAMLARPNSTDQEDVDRRARVRQRPVADRRPA